MQKVTFSYRDTQAFSSLILDYVEGNQNLGSFYEYQPKLSSFAAILKDIKAFSYNRELLTKVLKEQYSKLNPSKLISEQIESLAEENTFVVVTGHQTNLFGGPLYFLYKMASAIRLAEQIEKAYPDVKVVPFYWMGSEDHDWAEINNARVFGKKLEWEGQYLGASGRVDVDGLKPVLEELYSLLGTSEAALKTANLIKQAYEVNGRAQTKKTLAEATFELVDQLFGEQGLLVIEPDNPDFKKEFLPIAKRELKERVSFNAVSSTNAKLIEKGYHSQAFVRPINLFQLSENDRKRVVPTEGSDTNFNSYKGNDSKGLNDWLEYWGKHPEACSPNVFLRPVYQQKLLPSLAYVGGGGELAYWMQLKDLFKDLNVFYPMLVLRNSVMIQDAKGWSKWLKLGLTEKDLFLDEKELISLYIQSQGADWSIEEEKSGFDKLFDQIADKAKEIDPNLKSTVESEKAKFEKTFKGLNQRIVRAEKRQHEQALSQISKLKSKWFPLGSLQERKDNFIPFYQKYGEELIPILVKELDPLELKFTILREGKS